MNFKRISAFFMAAVMLFSLVAFTGCSKGAKNSDEAEKSGIITLNMFVLTEEETSEKAAKEVQMAINEITVPQHKMFVKINYLTEDEFWEGIEKAEKETISYISNKSAYKSDKVSIGDITFNEAIDYVFDAEDVELTKPQIDIFVVNDYDKFISLVEEERLAEIDVKYERKALVKFIHPVIFASAKVGKKTYGVPTNFDMQGEYEFLVFNKNLLDKYGYSVSDLTTLDKMGEYFSIIKSREPGYFPLSEIPETSGVEIYDNLIYAQSSLGAVSATSYPVYLNNIDYMNYLNTIASFRRNGYVADYYGINNAKYAVELVKSNELIEKEWTEGGVTYQAYLYDIPRVTAKEAFKSAMCVSAYSLEKAKAAELIELFNTDAELANMLQYGIEGKHYRIENGLVDLVETKAEDTYKMDNFLTGNVYIKYATEETADYIENAKKSNLAVAPSAFFGLYPSFNSVNGKAVYECVKTFSQTAFDMLDKGEITVADAFNVAGKQLSALGIGWDVSGNLTGSLGDLTNAQKEAAQLNASSFVFSEEAKTYNDVYLNK